MESKSISATKGCEAVTVISRAWTSQRTAGRLRTRESASTSKHKEKSQDLKEDTRISDTRNNSTVSLQRYPIDDCPDDSVNHEQT